MPNLSYKDIEGHSGVQNKRSGFIAIKERPKIYIAEEHKLGSYMWNTRDITPTRSPLIGHFT